MCAVSPQTLKGGLSETRIEKRIVITGDSDIDHDQVSCQEWTPWLSIITGSSTALAPPTSLLYRPLPPPPPRRLWP